VLQERLRLDGKIALLTGAARGIGRGIARALAEFGCDVAIQDIDLPAAEQTAAELARFGVKTMALGGDITKLEDVERFVPAVVERLGGIHILVNNAGVQFHGFFTEQTVEHFRKVMDGNLLASFKLIQQVTPIFKQQQFGRIINIGSIQGLNGNSWMTPYSMSKAAIQNLTSSLARDLGREGTTINGIAPGWFDTLRNQPDLTDEVRAHAKKRIPVGRHGTEEDCAGLALLLCSPAGAYINGEMILVDGGLSK
jgi:NAD(P)-dependent dehydrogenase (short-subunit alcohol dehydrogenase family)